MRLNRSTRKPGRNGSAAGANLASRSWRRATLGAVPMVAIAGSLAAKKIVPASGGTFPTNGPLFVGLVVGVILIVGGLTYFPALALGPLVEQVAMNAGTQF